MDSPPPQFDLGIRTASSDILAHELCKRSRIKRGLVSELEQENISQIPPAKVALNLSSHYNNIHHPPSSPIKTGLNLIQPGVKRRTLGDITPKKDKNILPPEPIDNLSNIPASPVRSLNPKKRWIKSVVKEEKQQSSRKIVLPSLSPNKGDEENLAMPIRWNENDSAPLPIPLIRRPLRPNSPINWGVVSALIDLRESTPQPLNLSTSGNQRSS